MKRFSIVVLLAACIGLGCGGYVYADTDLGQHCFQLLAGGQSATLRVSALQANGSELMIGIQARWRGVADASAYQLLGAGTFTQSHPPTAVWSMGLILVNPSGAFNANSLCHFHAQLDGNLNGSFSLDCFGLGEEPLTATGTMALVACTSAM
jgi:hypothetical protein